MSLEKPAGPDGTWLGRLPIASELHRRNAVALQIFSFVVIAGIVAVEAGRFLSGAAFRSPFASLFNLLTLSICLSAVLALRRGRYRRGVFLFVVALSATFALGIALGGIERSRDILQNIAIPLALSALLLGRRALLVTLGGYLLALAVAVARDHHLLGGTGPHPPPGSPLGLGGFSALVVVILAVVLDRFGLTVQEAYSAAVARQGELEATAAELRRANEALAAEMRERDRLQQELRQAQKMEAIGQLAGGVAHDFNNLLTVIGTNADLARMEEGLPAPVREGIEEIALASQRGAQLTRQLLAFGRRQVIQPRAFDLGAQVEGLRAILRRLLGEEVELAFELAPDLPAVLADPGQVEQILVNLVVNARDALPNHGRIAVATRLERVAEPAPDEGPQGDYAVLSVRDDGSGMTPDVLAHLFEPFFTTKGPGQGTGLGLSTVYGIARQHGGFVRVETAVSRGSAFHVFLPLAQRAADAVPSEAPLELSRRSGRLLLVEDDDAVRAATLSLLRRLGYEVLAARDGAEALELFRVRGSEIDALLTDVVMPKMNGRALADAVTALRPGLPVIFFSGYTEDVMASRGVLGSDVVLVRKPYQPAELAAALDRALRG